MKKLKVLLMAACMTAAISCGKKTDVVESGTYKGTVDEVEADKSEIYVETEDGKRLELYFTETTSLTQNGIPVEFSALAEGKKVQVQVKKTGNRLDPIAVEILE
jgi:cold shock protein